MNNLLRASLLGSLFFVLAFIVFCPRFYLWDPLGSANLPESNRAFYSLVQLQYSPFVKIPDYGNQVLEWRLLFPVIGHYLHLHWTIFFALAHISTLLLLIYAAHLVYSRTSSWAAAAVGTALTATSAAFFVSTGFLGYFDSALILALCISCFSSRPVTLWAAATLAPWVDERFIFALPIIFWCQWMRAQSFQGAFKKMLPILLGIAPYLFLRVLALVFNTDHSQTLFRDVTHDAHLRFWPIFLGLWDALRWGWVAAVLPILAAPRGPKVFALTLIPLALFGLLVCAGDYSRSMAIALPLMLYGLIVFWNQKSLQTQALLTGLAVLNFVMPAYHSFRAFHFPIFPLPIQLKIEKFIHTP